MEQKSSKAHAWFFVIAFIVLAIGSYFWAKSVRENYQAPEGVEIENRIPDPFRTSPGENMDADELESADSSTGQE